MPAWRPGCARSQQPPMLHEPAACDTPRLRLGFDTLAAAWSAPAA